jgi:dihydroorotase
MDCIIQNTTIIAPHSAYHQQKVSLLIKEGVISKISSSASDFSDDSIQKINAENLYLSIGWLDMRASFKDPGFEYKETLETGCLSAMKGGFTEVALLPNTQPVVQTKNEIAYLQKFAMNHLVDLHPIAAVTLETQGTDLTEMIDLHHAGAVAFSDGVHPIWHADIMLKTLLYLQMFDGLLMNRPEDTMLTQFGLMNEGKNAVILGLKGMPSLAEEMMIQRDLQLLEYTGGKLHFSLISAEKSVELIRQAKQKGLQVTCDIAAHQIAWDDSVMESFESIFKVNPPFRTTKDIEALWQGLVDGTIDAIVSDHNPQDEESKNLEFDLAEFGVIGLETAFAVINTHRTEGFGLEKLMDKIAYKPREILKLPIPQIAEGEKANLTLFSIDKEWTCTEKNIASKSKNSPFLNQTLKGKAVAVIHKNQLYYEENVG